MRRLLTLFALAAAACDTAGPVATDDASSRMQTVSSATPQPAALPQPPVLRDEAPPPKPKAMPWEKPAPIVFSPADEQLRASLPFTPAIAMDPVDGSKISIRATTPTHEYKGKIYYFSSEANRRSFIATPDAFLKGGGMMQL